MSLRHVDIKLREINVLIGPNGVGKSNFLSLFDLLGDLIEQRLALWVAKRGGADRVLCGGVKTSTRLSVDLRFDGYQGFEIGLALAAGGQLFFDREVASFENPDLHSSPFTENLGSGHTESRLRRGAEADPGKVLEHTLRCLEGVQRYHFHDTSETALIKQPQPVSENRALARDAHNLAPFLMAVRQNDPASFLRIEDAMRSVAPFFDSFVLQPGVLNENTVKLEWRHRDSDMYADAFTLSDGSLRFLCLATVLLQPSPPPIVLIDEPELGLHPFTIHQLADLMRSASKRCQIIVATQSVTLLDQLAIDDVIVADRIEGSTQLSRLDAGALGEWLDSYSLGELWEKNLLGGRPRSV